MNVMEIMRKDVATCGPGDSLPEIARIMSGKDCGILPVVDRTRKLLGVVTDRDVCLALAKAGTQASIGDAQTTGVRTCAPEDDLETALKAMGEKQVRRLPVVDNTGTLRGILSLSDVATAPGIPGEKVIDALKRIFARKGGKAAEAAVPLPNAPTTERRTGARRQQAERRTRAA